MEVLWKPNGAMPLLSGPGSTGTLLGVCQSDVAVPSPHVWGFCVNYRTILISEGKRHSGMELFWLLEVHAPQPWARNSLGFPFTDTPVPSW